VEKIDHSCTERFLRYVRFDTQSSEESVTTPSTEKQKKLGAVLVRELQEMGLDDAAMDRRGYVYATLPANVDDEVPVIGLIAHMDTSPEVSGENVQPQIHRNYQGGDIELKETRIRFEENPALAEQIGQDIITSDGTTLLGADDKAGIAEIFDTLHHLTAHPEIEHGTVKIAITPDEEIGRGADHFDVKKFGADLAYTIDGESAGQVEDETFCADSVTITVQGINVHPGYARGRMVNAIKIASELIAGLPRDSASPETTSDREGFVHPMTLNGGVEKTTLKFIVRDFTVEGLESLERMLKKLADEVARRFPGARLDFKVEESYRNMKFKLDEQPRVMEYALEAVRRAGLAPQRHAIRGGTDGARLSYMGLPTPNIFAGGHNFHSRQEWISVRDMQLAVQVILNLIQIWREKGQT